MSKVDVFTVDDVEFKRFRWWSNWVDVAVFSYDATPYLLQMKISRSNKKQFNAIRITGTYVYRQATTEQIGDLTPMSAPKTNS